MSTLTLKSPAKINLLLRVIEQRDDGYHLLQTAFQFIDLCDTLRFTLADELQIHGFNALTLQNNLIYRAALALTPYKKIDRGVNIEVQKQIPMGAGLGGGSSNAATTLLALNQLWLCALSQDKLLELALTLGADVPIFAYGHAAFAQGIGERLQAINPPQDYYLLVLPPVHASTAKVFAQHQLTASDAALTIDNYQANIGQNDLQKSACALYPQITEALAALNELAPAQMSGSGAAVFAPFKNKRAATKALKKLQIPFPKLICRGYNRSPLLEYWGVAKW